MTEDEKRAAQDLNEVLAANFLAVSVTVRSYSGKVTDNEVSDEVIHNKGAARKSGKFTKNLFVGADAELKEVATLGNAVRSLVYSRTAPLSSNSEGAQRGDRMVNAAKSLELLREIKGPVQDHYNAVQRFKAVFPQRMQEGMSNLNGMGKASDYPDISTLDSLFSIQIDMVPMPKISDFSRVNIPSALAEGLGQRYANQEKARVDNALADLKARLLKELQRMATMLGKAGAGEKTKLFDSLVTNLQDLVALTRSMNVYQNPELNA